MLTKIIKPRLSRFVTTGLAALLIGAATYRYSSENLPPLPTEYRVSEKIKGKKLAINLDQLLEREKTSERDSLLPQFVFASPENANPLSWQYVIVYSTAIGNAQDPNAITDQNGNPNTWCNLCNALAKEKTYERIKEGLSEMPEVGLIKILCPYSKTRPSYFEIEGYEGVPASNIFENKNGFLTNLIEIHAPNAKAYADETLNSIAQLRIKCKLNSQILREDDFRNLKIYRIYLDNF